MAFMNALQSGLELLRQACELTNIHHRLKDPGVFHTLQLRLLQQQSLTAHGQ